MPINPDTSKPVLFSRKKKTKHHPDISVNNIQVERVSHQKHLGIILDEKLNFKEHIDKYYFKSEQGYSRITKTQI